MAECWDAVVVGGGPAGAAAAIACAEGGLRTLLLERERGPSRRPGETLAPGSEQPLARLGVTAALARAGCLRPRGIRIEWGQRTGFQSFGPAGSDWRGYQVPRALLDALLRERAQAAGAELRRAPARAPLLRAGRVIGVHTPAGPLECAAVIDASGRSRFLSRALGLQVWRSPQRLLARYGYAAGELADGEPSLRADRREWRWIAPIGAGRIAWVRVGLGGAAPCASPPPELAALAPEGPARAEDVTWSSVRTLAGAGFLLAGDAAARLDPASSHGVLRALLSGLAAGGALCAVARGELPEHVAGQRHQHWLHTWFERDARALAALYAELDAGAPAVAAAGPPR